METLSFDMWDSTVHLASLAPLPTDKTQYTLERSTGLSRHSYRCCTQDQRDIHSNHIHSISNMHVLIHALWLRMYRVYMSHTCTCTTLLQYTLQSTHMYTHTHTHTHHVVQGSPSCCLVSPSTITCPPSSTHRAGRGLGCTHLGQHSP